MDKTTLIRNFSRCAHSYDAYADVQKRSAAQLLAFTPESSRCMKILEIGCGTGNLTLLLRERFKYAEIKAIDISEKMVEVAAKKLNGKGVKFIIADAETIILDEGFDLIASNACFQWFDDLENALLKYCGLLNEGGTLLFSMFGPSTFGELNAALTNTFRRASTSSVNFYAKEKITGILKRGLKAVKVGETEYRESFPSLRELLNRVKYTGIRGAGFNAGLSFTSRSLQRLEEEYLGKFNEIRATYQVFFCRGLSR
ncbi:MAG: malonyl-ACP O-methyltransferase BioC [Deltaproteobacteria bacterium]